MELSISIILLFPWAPLELSPGFLKSLFLIGGELASGAEKSIGLLSSCSLSSANIKVFPSRCAYGLLLLDLQLEGCPLLDVVKPCD